MRRPIWLKDDFFPFGDKRIDMDPSVVTIRPGLLPLTWMYHFSEPGYLLGHVDDVRLEEGVISGEVNLLDDKNGRAAADLLEHGDVRLGGYYSDVYKTPEGDRVLACTLRAVAVVMMFNGANPGAKV